MLPDTTDPKAIERPFLPFARVALFWFMVANLIGCLLSLLLVFPNFNDKLFGITYGRWVPLHLNLQLYGWVSICLLALIFKFFMAKRPEEKGQNNQGRDLHRSHKSVVLIWSTALVVGAVSWLKGDVSGKVFLDWRGPYALVFLLAISLIWVQLLLMVIRNWNQESKRSKTAKTLVLFVLAMVPLSLAFAFQPGVYPAVNPQSGGPTGTSLLGSTLGILLLFLMFPYILDVPSIRKNSGAAWYFLIWGLEMIFFLAFGHGDQPHHNPLQITALALLLPWPIFLFLFLRRFVWHQDSTIWMKGLLFWFAMLVWTAFTMFLPGFNEHLKFTNALVGHAHMALAGCVTCFCMLTLTELPIGERLRKALANQSAFYGWNSLLFLMIVILIGYGWVEGSSPWTEVIGSRTRHLIYVARSLLGLGMASISILWFLKSMDLSMRLFKIGVNNRRELNYVLKEQN